MIYGIGIDITEISRVLEMSEDHKGFLEKVLTPNEIQQYNQRVGKKKAEYLAGRFSAKESFSKAFGTGIGSQVGFQNIEIIDDQLGKPQLSQDIFDGPAYISISHTDLLVTSEVILEEG